MDMVGGDNMFAQRLRELRKRKKLTMKELGRKFNLAESTISGYENGNRTPDLEVIEKIADYFEVSTDYLLGRDGEFPKTKEEWDKADPEHKERFKKLIEIYEKASPEGKELMIHNMEMILNLDQKKNRS